MTRDIMQNKTVYDALPVAISLHVLPDMKVHDVNSAWLQLFGFMSAREVRGRAPGDLGIDGGLNTRQLLTELKASRSVIRHEMMVNSKTGRRMVLIASHQLITIKWKRYILASYEDITRLREAESALVESESRLCQYAETSNEGIWWIDPQLETTYLNGKMTRMLGMPAKAIKDSRLTDFMDEEGKKLIGKKLEGIPAGEKRTFGHLFLKSDGTFLHGSVNASPVYDAKGVYSGMVLLISDLAERVNVERALRKTRRKLDLALENGSIGTWEWNVRTGELTCDERTKKMTGISGCSLSDLEGSIHEDDLPHVREAFRKSVEKGSFETIFRTRKVNGHESYISLKGLLLSDRKGRPMHVSGVMFDVTGMKKGAEQSLFRLNEELLRSNNDLKQFAYVASHDLQEPLRMVSSFTQLLQHRYKDKLDADGNEYIRFAVEGSKRMYELINGLLAYSRVQTRGAVFGNVDLNDVLRKVLDNLQLALCDRNIRVENVSLPVVFADESQMIQLLQNLIENGIKFSPEGKVIKVASVRDKDKHVISVSDQGIGIEHRYFEKIFRIFQRLHRPDEYKGTGIGLAICKRIVERHGGCIWVESQPGKGSTFLFSLPSADVHREVPVTVA